MHNDCVDKSDEEDCPNPSECPSGTIPCYDGSCLPNKIQNDLMPDCPGNVWEDEQLINVQSRGNVLGRCDESRKSSSRCMGYHPYACFERSQTCVYDTDEKGNLIGCRNAAHLQNCAEFRCPHMFKCPGSYCVPYHKVCDGIYDCPGRVDEKGWHHDRPCRGQFRCKKPKVCLDMSRVCDQKEDCKYGEDEHFCWKSECPEGCVCRGLIVQCLGAGRTTLPSIPTECRANLFSGNMLDITNVTFRHFSSYAPFLRF